MEKTLVKIRELHKARWTNILNGTQSKRARTDEVHVQQSLNVVDTIPGQTLGMSLKTIGSRMNKFTFNFTHDYVPTDEIDPSNSARNPSKSINISFHTFMNPLTLITAPSKDLNMINRSGPICIVRPSWFIILNRSTSFRNYLKRFNAGKLPFVAVFTVNAPNFATLAVFNVDNFVRGYEKVFACDVRNLTYFYGGIRGIR